MDRIAKCVSNAEHVHNKNLGKVRIKVLENKERKESRPYFNVKGLTFYIVHIPFRERRQKQFSACCID